MSSLYRGDLHQEDLYIGIMSGTSADGIDAVLLEIRDQGMTLRGHCEVHYTDQQRQEILELCQPGNNEIQRMGKLDRQLGLAFAEAVQELLQSHKLTPAQIRAIGSHGQTIRHHPPSSSNEPFTVQIADPNIIAEVTGITTVADFRRRDIAAGGEGAPLVPAFHQAAFSQPEQKRVIVNIGGIANITQLFGNASSRGFDTGPGNVLMDSWSQTHLNKRYDDRGKWAKSGSIQPQLLQLLLEQPYFNQPPPKSTGRELFHYSWLLQQLTHLPAINPVDVQATLLELTALTIHQAIGKLEDTADAIFICGGGTQNDALMERLQQLSSAPVSSTATLGIEPQQVEAAAFAWLAYRTLHHQTGNAPAATGAKRSVILGGIYQG